MNFKIITLGCKVNTYESEFMREELLKSGYLYNEEQPDIIIINTCSVTNMADSKSKKIVRREKRENPNSILVVCGCSSENNREEYTNLGADILLGNRKKSEIVSLLQDFQKSHQKYSYFTNSRDLSFENMQIKRFNTHTRAFIKIQDGCNNFCSYCIIPYTRGDIRSKDYDETINEIKTLVANGHKEIVLTGIHTGSYNSNNHDLSDLIREISKIENLSNIRISSIEITELNDKFLKTLKEIDKICNHLHIPLQSGSDNILKRMNRKYDKEYFRNKIAKIREIRPGISITTDCIVGHPYETDEDFIEYLNFCKEIKFSKIHVFPYSIRNGTASALMPQVDNKIKKERTKKLIELSNILEQEYSAKFIGKELIVLTEEYEGDFITGHTTNYLKIYLKGDYKLNERYLCKITNIENSIIHAVVLTCLNTKIAI